MTATLKRYSIWLLVVSLAACFILLNSGLDMDFIIPRRLSRLAAIVLGGICVGWSAVVFQTLTGNRILTPAVMGYEAVYLFWQALLMLVLGTQSLVLLGADGNFLLSLVLMLGYSWLIQRWLLKGQQHNLFLLLLAGLVLTMVISTVTQFVQLLVSPGEFSVLLSLTQTSFSRAAPAQLLLSVMLVLVVCGASLRTLPTLDALTLGREQAISIGIDYRQTLRQQLALIAILVAVSTSLVGPTAFMGIFVANIAYALAGTFRHRVTLSFACATAITLFLVAQLAVEHLFNYRTTVGILVNLVCGVWFLALLLRKRRAL